MGAILVDISPPLRGIKLHITNAQAIKIESIPWTCVDQLGILIYQLLLLQIYDICCNMKHCQITYYVWYFMIFFAPSISKWFTGILWYGNLMPWESERDGHIWIRMKLDWWPPPNWVCNPTCAYYTYEFKLQLNIIAMEDPSVELGWWTIHFPTDITVCWS